MSGRIAITSQRKVSKKKIFTSPRIELHNLPRVEENSQEEESIVSSIQSDNELSLHEMCKIAVWMDQFQSEDIVQIKFKSHFASKAPSKEKISLIHRRFLETGSVLEESISMSLPFKDEQSLTREKEEFAIQEGNCIEELGLDESLDREDETSLPLETLLVESKEGLAFATKEREGEVTMLCNQLEENELFSEISISEGESKNKLVSMEVIYSCVHCGYKTSNKESYDLHLETHGTDFFQCTKCNFTSNNTTAFRSHVKLCDRDTKVTWNASVDLRESSSYLCPECGKAYSSANALKTHKTFHSALRPYVCSQCKYRFKTETDLRKHMETHDKIHNLECPYCNFTCGVKSKMIVHIRAHSGEKPFKCPQCDYQSSSKIMLKRHIFTHDKSNMYKCSECSYTTHRVAFLKNHQLTHSEKKNFKCQVCPLSFKTPNTLNYHMNKVHTKHKLYECPFCDFRQPILHALKVHIRTHTGEKPHTCPHCEFKCVRSQELKKHIQMKHE